MIVKPKTGYELGTAFDEVGQTFLDTKPLGRPFAVGTRHKVKIEKRGATVTVHVDGWLISTFTSTNPKKALYMTKGAVGVYTEDAAVKVHDFTLTEL